ncbi:MAG TPA: pantoate--beta-alanine ligase [Steroidobacteraceae bacterium]|jgi:pantoate--beta-alanine ligase|nr:pantoate--beta-alanine ligase [Steroidobacteraceae bacterium]
METVSTIEAVRARIRDWRRSRLRIAFVPTMGNLHAGHMSLLEAAHSHGDRVVASIFVNPLQFGPSEDYTAYPRTLADDQKLLEQGGCDLLFAPSVNEMYPTGGDQRTLVTVRGLSNVLDGEFRPGHFDGVATVVTKLFGIVAPDVAVFGEKDYQQLLVVRNMTLDLALPVEIVGAPTVRAEDGLALSSRNRYLSAEERARAPAIHHSLLQAAQALSAGTADYALLQQQGGQWLERSGMKLDYFSIRNASDLTAPTPDSKEFVILVAARLGRARLIDNMRARRA